MTTKKKTYKNISLTSVNPYQLAYYQRMSLHRIDLNETNIETMISI